MENPFNLLEIPETADDAAIKKAYLAKVRSFPPERCPEEFERIYQAWELIKDEEARASYRLFHAPRPEPAEIAALLLKQKKSTSPATCDEFNGQLREDLQAFCRTFEI